MENLSEIMALYDISRQMMRDNGNDVQWINGYPSKELVTDDIEKGYCHICVDNGEIVGVFALIFGNDHTYNVIEGQWLNDNPYAAIHRLGAKGKGRGIVSAVTDFAGFMYSSLRADTHEKNIPMQKAMEKCGYVKCGIIYIDDGTPRVAYQKDCK